MPKEDRRIIFDLAEVYKAIYSLRQQKQMGGLPPGHIKSLTEKGEDQSAFLIAIENPQDNTKDHIEVSKDFMAAALMLFCRGHGIPLPRGGHKSVTLGGGDVTLRIVV
jgi:hypothetical protein